MTDEVHCSLYDPIMNVALPLKDEASSSGCPLQRRKQTGSCRHLLLSERYGAGEEVLEMSFAGSGALADTVLDTGGALDMAGDLDLPMKSI